MSEKPFEPLNLKPGSGMLFKNKRKTEEKHPEYVGEIEIPPEMVGRKQVSLWKRTSKSGNTYLSIGLSEPWKPKPKAAPARPQPAQADPDFDDDLPF